MMSANVWIWILSILVVVLAGYIVVIKFGCSASRSGRTGGNASGVSGGVSGEEVAAIALALSLYNGGTAVCRNGNGHNGNKHHNGSHWNSKAFAMSEMPERKRR